MSSGQRTRVLLVEDSPTQVQLVRDLLARRPGLEITGAGSLGEALRLAGETCFEVMLLDLSLPDSSGLDSLRRAQAAAPQLPVIVMTGVADQAVALEAVALGAQDYLVKGTFDGALLAAYTDMSADVARIRKNRAARRARMGAAGAQ